MLVLVAALACQTVEVSEIPVGSGEVAVDAVPSDSSGRMVPLVDSGAPQERGTPVACPEDINVPTTGADLSDRVLADAHAETYGAAPQPRHVHLGLPGDPATSITVLWRTDHDTLASRVEIGADDAFGAVVEGRSFVLGTNTADGRIHEVRICGLAPDTAWRYRVGGEQASSRSHAFATGPAPGSTAPFVIGVAGDSRGDPSSWTLALEGMAARGADFRLFTGDAVSTGTSIPNWDEWFDAGAGHLESSFTVMAHSNHDGLAQAWFALAANPGNEQWFSFDYGNVHFVSFNDTIASNADWLEQKAWLEADLAASTQPWKIALHHKPAFSSCTIHTSDINVLNTIVPVEEAGGVDLDIAGHNHNYERSVPIRAGARDDENGIVYLVTAGAGAPLYTNDGRNALMEVGLVTEHYVILTIQDDIATIVAYDLAGNVIDSKAIQKR